MTKHILTLHDPLTGTDQPVQITLERQGDEWTFYAHFDGAGRMLTSGQNLWFEREEDVLALAQERTREAMRARDPRAFPKV